MHLTIHRGTHEIGGTCIELQAGATRLILDVGSPLDADLGDGSLEAVKEFLPKVKGLFKDDPVKIPASVLISHSHPDHTGFIEYLNDGTDVYMSKTTDEIIKLLDIFINWTGKPCANPHIINGNHNLKNRELKIDNYTITAFDVDHSSPGSLAFVIKNEKENKTIVYTGDTRAHGKKGPLFDMFIKACPKNPDILLMEGTMVGSEREGVEESEKELELRIAAELKRQAKPVLTNFSLTNGDRLITLLNACIRADYELVIDLPTAMIYERFRELGWKIKPIYEMPIKVFYLKGHMRPMLEKGVFDIGKKLRPQEIEVKDIFSAKNRLVLFKESQLHYFKDEANVPKGLLLMMSKWWEKPYPGQEASYEAYMAFIKEKNLDLNKTFHVSGHAYTKDLKTLAESINPKMLIPIHTNSPDAFKELLPGLNVRVLTDNETITI